jgi:hypothetical protein
VKIILGTLLAWAVCVAIFGYWYVVVGAGWPVVAAEYEQWKDYRFGFFLLAWLPVFLLVLGVLVFLEWWVLLRRRPRGIDQ